MKRASGCAEARPHHHSLDPNARLILFIGHKETVSKPSEMSTCWAGVRLFETTERLLHHSRKLEFVEQVRVVVEISLVLGYARLSNSTIQQFNKQFDCNYEP